MKLLLGLVAFVFASLALPAAEFRPGDSVEVRWGDKWAPATVLERSGNAYKVNYEGGGRTGVEWVIPSKMRLAEAATATADDDDDPEGEEESDEDEEFEDEGDEETDEEEAEEEKEEEAPAAPAPVRASPAKAPPAVPAARPAPAAAAQPAAGAWKVGDRVEGLSYGAWYPATVIEVRADQWKVHYDGYGDSSDEWLPVGKVRPMRRGSWKVGDRVEALSYGKWYKATIIEAEESRWKVKYDGYGDGSNECVLLDRVRAIGATTAGGSDREGKAVEKYAFPARPAGARAGIEGAFFRLETYYFSGSLSLDNQGWFFTKDGKFSKEPVGGFDPEAFAASNEASKTDGSYWIEGSTLTLAWADSAKRPTVYQDFENKGDELRWSGLGSIRVKGFKKGWRFDGEYEGGASVGGGAVMSSTTITFFKDGTFRRGSVGSVRIESDRSVVSGGGSNEARGTYEFDTYTLTMNEHGETKRFTVFAYGDADGAGRPERIYREGTMMKRQ